MIVLLSIIAGLLFGASIYQMLQKSIFKIIVGVIIYGYATTFFVFGMGGFTRSAPPLIEKNEDQHHPKADPLPQALVLTAIVIGIGVQIFVIVLFKMVHEKLGKQDVEQLRQTDSDQ